MTTRANRQIRFRRMAGTSILEIPAVLWMLFVVMLPPMLALGSIALKSALFTSAVQTGAQVASKARTFQVSANPQEPSAVQLADSAIRNGASKFSGLVIDSVTTNIVITPVNNGAITRSASKLSIPADSSQFIYQIETVATGKITPLIPVSPQFVGNLPGVSVPFTVTCAARQMAENPQGLNQ